MPRRSTNTNREQVEDYRHDEARRRNNPPAGIAPTYEARERQTQTYSYDPHLDPQSWVKVTDMNGGEPCTNHSK
jgi:adenine-specific DNA-methyltransferase